MYYGDESARSLDIQGTEGDATLRSFMNWDDIKNNSKTKEVLKLWQKLGNFRAKHQSVGAGIHKMISQNPYVFSRTFSNKNYTDNVVVALDLPTGKKEISVGTIFKNGTKVKDAYSGKTAIVANSKVTIDSEFTIILLEKM